MKHTTYNLEPDTPLGNLTEKICAVLTEEGPMTPAQIKKALQERYGIGVTIGSLWRVAHYVNAPPLVRVSRGMYAVNKDVKKVVVAAD